MVAHDVECRYDVCVKTQNPHERIDRINLAMDQLIAAKIRSHPCAVNIARDNLRRWIENDGGFVHPRMPNGWISFNFWSPESWQTSSRATRRRRIDSGSPAHSRESSRRTNG